MKIDLRMALIISNLIHITEQSTGMKKPWILYPAQRMVLKSLLSKQNTIILKARQLGISTLVLYYTLLRVLTEPGISIAVVANNFSTSIKLTKDLRNMAEQLNIGIASSSMKHIEFSNSSFITTLTAGAATTGRGRTFSLIVLSEAGFYDKSEESMASLLPALTIDGQIIMESTATATDTVFRRTWEDESSKYNKIFLGMECHSNYRANPNEIDDELWEYLRDEFEFSSRGAASWWWQKIQSSGGDEILGIREYPNTPKQAFLAAEGLWIKRCPDILPYKSDVKYKDIHIFKAYDKNSVYVFSVDTASGGGGETDDSVILVWDVLREEIAASFVSNEVSMDFLTDLIVYLNFIYMPKFIIVEKNGIGAGTVEFGRKKNLPIIEYDANPASRHKGFVWAKRKVEGGLNSDEHLRENCLSCTVVPTKSANGVDRFIGKKDVIAALSFIGNFEDKMKTLVPLEKKPAEDSSKVFRRPNVLNRPKGQSKHGTQGLFK